MKRQLVLVLTLLPLITGATMRERIRIDDGWRFCLGGDHADPDSAKGEGWRAVQLPHDYVVEGGFERNGDSSHGFRPKPVGWYERNLDLSPRPGQRYWIEFDGVFRDAKIWLNGLEIGGHKSGYTSFYFDVTGNLRPSGHNLLVVRVDPSQNEGWWYEGGGIYRHVWLSSVPSVHLDHWGTFVSTPRVSEARAEVHAETVLNNETGRGGEFTVVSTVMLGSRAVSTAEKVVDLPPGRRTLPQDLGIEHPLLWSPESPNLYRLRTELKMGGTEVDRVETTFGVRTVRFDPDSGFFLNGKHYELKGAAIHQDFAGVGVAITDNLQVLRLKMLQSMGCNAVRCAHNPPAPELLDACDELGILVLDENRHAGDTFDAKSKRDTPTNDMSELDSMVLRDRNHPSIIAWSLCNEEWDLQMNADGVRILGALNKRVKELDPSRPTTLAMGGGAQTGRSPNLRDVVDVTGANYGPDGYDPFHRDYPAEPLVATEFCALCKTRGIYENDPAHGYMTCMPEQLTGQFAWMKPEDLAWAPIASRPFMAGGFVWSGFDYRGEPTPWKWPYDWPDVISATGEMDLCGFPKDGYYYLQSVWGPGDQPIVHILPHWNWPDEIGKEKTVCVYSNAEQVQLSLNGKELGPPKAVPPYGHVEWTVPYAPGTLLAQGYRGLKPFGQEVLETTGPAASIVLKTEGPPGTSDPEDLICVVVELRDSAGRLVPTACNQLQFSVNGPASIVGAGNGDTSDHEPESTATLTAKAFSYKSFNGSELVILRPSGVPGRIMLTAEGAGLGKTDLVLQTRRAAGPVEPRISNPQGRTFSRGSGFLPSIHWISKSTATFPIETSG